MRIQTKRFTRFNILLHRMQGALRKTIFFHSEQGISRTFWL
ncbi:hypothetical protein MPF_1666 [Methanohalophilus portucalensis FDF-1]|uniref:Uncharacterized protein n=1 Tax=Methanohalophilus portucalensis FDF-1 TaxID=523843 RepID=A0A1L9C326_9EURY|nr:hypothetical protein MPF_1666 [Methanohalophilus portucalensis FDF-1]